MTSEKVNSEFKIIDTVYTPTFDGVYVETHLEHDASEPNIINVEIPYGSTYVVSNILSLNGGIDIYNAFGFILNDVLHVFLNNSKFIGIDDQNKVCIMDENSTYYIVEDFIDYQTPSTPVPDSWVFEELDCTIGDVINITVGPEPIAPEGEVQVFADPYCTRYADGLSGTVYVRLNLNFGFGEGKSYNGGSDGQRLVIATPSSQYPEDSYGIMCWTDWIDNERDYTQPFTSGEVVKCVFVSFDPQYPVDNPKVIFE